MKQKQMNEILIDTLKTQNEMYDFCIECIKELFKEDTAHWIYTFEQTIENLDYNCLSLSCMFSEREEMKKRVEAQKSKKNG